MHGFQSFDGLPIMVTLFEPGLHHVMVLPAQPVQVLVDLARAQVEANRLPMWLVLDENCVLHFDEDGGPRVAAGPPQTGALITARLAPPVTFIETDDLRDRQDRLFEFAAETNRGRRFVPDETKGGRQATADELTRLAGRNDDGSPRGLERCPTCRDWRGTCLDPCEEFSGQVMAVHCLCENHNRCARCGVLLDRRRLNANFYDPSNGQIWHASGGRGALHQCSVDIHWEQSTPAGLPAGDDARRPGTRETEITNRAADDEYPQHRVEVYFRSDGDPNRLSLYCQDCGPNLPGASPGVVFDGRGRRCKRCGRGLVA